jgi:Leucine-rich repeat (LRR) protein
MSICVDMKTLSTSIGKLNALLELNLSGCSSLKELPTFIGQLNALQELNLSMFKFTKITYIYWPIKCTSKP